LLRHTKEAQEDNFKVLVQKNLELQRKFNERLRTVDEWEKKYNSLLETHRSQLDVLNFEWKAETEAKIVTF